MGTAQPHPERRRFSRITFHRPATLAAGGTTCQAAVLDVSLQGALLDVPPALAAPAGSPCTLVIPLDGDEAVIRLEGEVVRRAGARLGMRCTSVDLESVGHLRRVVELNLGDEELLHRELAALIGCSDP